MLWNYDSISRRRPGAAGLVVPTHATVSRHAGFLALAPVQHMADPIQTSVSTRLPVAFPPRWGFWKGLLTGAVIEVPAIAGGIWLLARMGVGNRDAGFMTILR